MRNALQIAAGFLLISSFCIHSYAQDCGQNLGFEEGSLTNWEASRYDGNPGKNCGPMYMNEVLLPPTCPYPPCVTCEDAPCKDPNDPSMCPIQPETGFGFTGAPQVNAQLDCPQRLQPSTVPRFSLTSGTVADPNEPTINPVSQHPLSGNFSAKIGNTGTGYQAECMWNRFLVTEQNKMFIFSYAVFLEDPIVPINQHHLYDSPRFSASLLNDQGEEVGCGTRFSALSMDARDVKNGFEIAQDPFCSITPENDPSEDDRNVSNVYYRDWRNVSVNLSNEVGNYVTIKFCTADCGRGGHYAYAYVDIFCPPPQQGYFLCSHGEPVTLSGPPGFGDYEWYKGADTNGTALDTGFNYVVQNPEHGDMYTVKYKPEFGSECNTLVVTDTIYIYEAYAEGDTMYCDKKAPDSLVYKAYSNAPATVYNWRSIPAGYTSTGPDLILKGNDVPMQNMQFIVNMRWDEYSCFEEDTITIVVEPCGIEIEVPSFEYCLNNPEEIECFLVEATVTGGEPPLTFKWEGLPFDPGDTDKVQVCTAVPVSYTVSVIDADSMTASASGQINVFYPPAVTIEPDSFCENFGLGRLTANVEGGNTPYTFQWNDPNRQTTQTADNLAEGTYTVTVIDAKGCWDTASSWIKTYSFKGGSWYYIDCPGAIIQLETTPGGETYRWRPATGLSNPNGRRPLTTINEPITYMVEVSTGDRCGWIDTVQIEIDYDPTYTLHIPNSFTPNGDGNDDFFQYQGDFSGIVKFECQIWNRWGEQIFQTFELTDYWNGKYNNVGEFVKDGAYVYIIKAKDDCVQRKKWAYRFGWVIVLKGDPGEQ